MKNVRFINHVSIIAVKKYVDKEVSQDHKLLDFYLINKKGEWLYAFTDDYRHNVYDLCKGGYPVNDLLSKRGRDRGMANFIRMLKRMLPYLASEYDLAITA